jgi:hypothetical protein
MDHQLVSTREVAVARLLSGGSGGPQDVGDVLLVTAAGRQSGENSQKGFYLSRSRMGSPVTCNNLQATQAMFLSTSAQFYQLES